MQHAASVSARLCVKVDLLTQLGPPKTLGPGLDKQPMALDLPDQRTVDRLYPRASDGVATPKRENEAPSQRAACYMLSEIVQMLHRSGPLRLSSILKLYLCGFLLHSLSVCWLRACLFVSLLSLSGACGVHFVVLAVFRAPHVLCMLDLFRLFL
jgi:hypothetical protein